MSAEKNKKLYRCTLQTLSPVHIGCDEVYEPMGFVVDENDLQLIVFDPLAFLSELDQNDRERFSQICRKGTVGSILEIYKFFKGKATSGRKIPVCNDFVDHYRQTLSISVTNEKKVQHELNQFAIPRTAYNTADQRPYIPGSAVKGALRTAYLNGISSVKKVPEQKGKDANRKLENALLDYRTIPEDPFRLVKVSDFAPVGAVQTRIVYGVNEKKNPGKNDISRMPLLYEVIQPGTLFEGSVVVDSPLKGSKVNHVVHLSKLLETAVSFFTNEKDREDKELGRIGVQGIAGPDGEKSCLIRIGRHSGAESLTIAGHRQIGIMIRPGKYVRRPGATTFWLASEVRRPKLKKNLQPFGWLQLTELTQEQEKDLQEREQAWKINAAAEQESRRSKAEMMKALQQEAEEAEQQQAREAERKQKEEERRRAEFEAMSPEERAIAEIKDPSVYENRVVEIFNQLDGFSETYRKKLAQALKDYWITHGKWIKKQCSPKQLEKVQKVKEVLGEQ